MKTLLFAGGTGSRLRFLKYMVVLEQSTTVMTQ